MHFCRRRGTPAASRRCHGRAPPAAADAKRNEFGIPPRAQQQCDCITFLGWRFNDSATDLIRAHSTPPGVRYGSHSRSFNHPASGTSVPVRAGVRYGLPAMAFLCVVRFRGSGAGEYSKLALCVSCSDNSKVMVIYSDWETVVDTSVLCKALEVNVKNMCKKAIVLETVLRDASTLRRKLPDYQDVRRARPSTAEPRAWCLVCHTLRRTLRNTARRFVCHRSLPVSTKP